MAIFGGDVSAHFNECSFCGIRASQAEVMLTGDSIAICGGCVDIAGDLARQKRDEKHARIISFPEMQKVMTPRAIKGFLDDYVVGQDPAKKVLAVAVYNHFKRLQTEQDLAAIEKEKEESKKYAPKRPGAPVMEAVTVPPEVRKSNVLVLGPTGSGKTLLAETIARFLDIPFIAADATSLTEAGYVGEDVDSMLSRLIQKADGDIEKAQRGIIYIDEIDKIARAGEARSSSRDVSGEGVQQGLLKMLEGSIVLVQPTGNKRGITPDPKPFDTRNVLFICGGAFSGIDKIVAERTSGRGTLSFAARLSQESGRKKPATVTPDDLHKFGMIPEFVGRLPIITSTEALDEKALAKVLTEPKDALVKQYQHLASMDDIDLEFTPGALTAIARLAQDHGTGARGLRAIVEGLLLDTMFELPELAGRSVKKVVVTEAAVEGKATPLLLRENESLEQAEARATPLVLAAHPPAPSLQRTPG